MFRKFFRKISQKSVIKWLTKSFNRFVLKTIHVFNSLLWKQKKKALLKFVERINIQAEQKYKNQLTHRSITFNQTFLLDYALCSTLNGDLFLTIEELSAKLKQSSLNSQIYCYIAYLNKRETQKGKRVNGTWSDMGMTRGT